MVQESDTHRRKGWTKQRKYPVKKHFDSITGNKKKSSTKKDEPTNIYELYDPSHRRRLPQRLQKSFSNQAQEWINPNKYFSEHDLMYTT